MSNMETVSKIKKLMQNVGEIRSLFFQKIPMWKKDPSHYDKTGWGFNIDSRFNACEPIQVAFSSWKGVYGDSGCSTQTKLDKDVFRDHLLKHLNANKETIMLAVADSIEREARELKAQAQKELEAQIAKLQELEEVVTA